MEISFKDIHDAILNESKNGVPFPYELKTKPEKIKPAKIKRIKRDISIERAKDLILEKKKAGCFICGYSKYTGALEFHHIDPSTKSFSIGGNGAGKNLNEILKELAKCVLLCSNCHREVHGGLIKL